MNAHNAPPTNARVPTFASIEEEAAFWDSHDTGAFEDEFEPVEIEVARPLAHSWEVVARFDEATFQRFQAIAKERGVSLPVLARKWLLEALERAEQLPLTSRPDRQ